MGKGYSVQANLMINKGVPEAMEKAFLKSKGDLTGRLLQALEAAQAEGGDLRGKQSAAVLVVSARKEVGGDESGRLVDLHVEDNAEPLKELRRLYKLHQAYDHMNKGDLAIEEKNIEKALREYGRAEKMFPENLEMKFWHAISLVQAKRVEQSLPLFRFIFQRIRIGQNYLSDYLRLKLLVTTGKFWIEFLHSPNHQSSERST